MTDHEPLQQKKPPTKHCAILWDESFLWGLMAWQGCIDAGLPFDLIRCEDISRGALHGYQMLFVPGGWASNKLSALGEKGANEIRRFVAAGGSYLGICGGAGLATEDGLGLLPIQRMSPAERVPSFSGPICLACLEHPIWKNVKKSVFYAWWPSQFCIQDPSVNVIATYGEAGADAFSSDIQVADGMSIGWPELERRYGIFLDPSRLRGEPAVMEGRFGRGKVILSLIHFDTPGETDSARVLQNIWRYLSSEACLDQWAKASRKMRPLVPALTPNSIEGIKEVEKALAELIAVGTRNFLWSWRNPLLLQWRRGIRGLEYSTLAAMIDHILRHLDLPHEPSSNCQLPHTGPLNTEDIERLVTNLRAEFTPFVQKAITLLIRERFYLMQSPLSPLVCSDESISRLRNELFGPAMSHGGHFKRIIDLLDQILFPFTKGILSAANRSGRFCSK